MGKFSKKTKHSSTKSNSKKYSTAELRQLFVENRSSRSISIDLKKTAKRTTDNPELWIKRPNRYDFPDVDTAEARQYYEKRKEKRLVIFKPKKVKKSTAEKKRETQQFELDEDFYKRLEKRLRKELKNDLRDYYKEHGKFTKRKFEKKFFNMELTDEQYQRVKAIFDKIWNEYEKKGIIKKAGKRSRSYIFVGEQKTTKAKERPKELEEEIKIESLKQEILNELKKEPQDPFDLVENLREKGYKKITVVEIFPILTELEKEGKIKLEEKTENPKYFLIEKQKTLKNNVIQNRIIADNQGNQYLLYLDEQIGNSQIKKAEDTEKLILGKVYKNKQQYGQKGFFVIDQDPSELKAKKAIKIRAFIAYEDEAYKRMILKAYKEGLFKIRWVKIGDTTYLTFVSDKPRWDYSFWLPKSQIYAKERTIYIKDWLVKQKFPLNEFI